MRTYVRMMTSSPYRPVRELEAAIARGELDFALAHAKEVARERRAPLDLGLALDLLTLVAAQQRHAYDGSPLRARARGCCLAAERIARVLFARPRSAGFRFDDGRVRGQERHRQGPQTQIEMPPRRNKGLVAGGGSRHRGSAGSGWAAWPGW